MNQGTKPAYRTCYFHAVHIGTQGRDQLRACSEEPVEQSKGDPGCDAFSLPTTGDMHIPGLAQWEGRAVETSHDSSRAQWMQKQEKPKPRAQWLTGHWEGHGGGVETEKMTSRAFSSQGAT